MKHRAGSLTLIYLAHLRAYAVRYDGYVIGTVRFRPWCSPFRLPMEFA
jgi:hypothetical protein